MAIAEFVGRVILNIEMSHVLKRYCLHKPFKVIIPESTKWKNDIKNNKL